jgi:hypothetical protein
MDQDRFQKHMRAYDRWKGTLAAAIQAYQHWLDEHAPGSGEIELRLFETLEGLRSDRVSIAVVAEFSRGKTELLNAIFFADHGRRLLPSEPGRTTMCPTELFDDREAGQSYVRLLPIETRQEDLSIAEYKRDPQHWTTIKLDVRSPEQMADAFREVTRVKQVRVETARRLGLYSEDLHGKLPDDGEVEVPVWRHALISFPHPLLQQGLAVFDTPGLNALGSEPELTLNMLPSAHALIFMLAADTGVTRSDLDLWRHHVTGPYREHSKGLVVVLNKIDTLWDELKDTGAIAGSIKSQCAASAETLGVPEESIFPLSAQKGLLAKVRRDRALLERSRILALEAHLAEQVLPARQRLLRSNVLSQVGTALENSIDGIAARIEETRGQLEELRGLSGKNADVIMHLMRKAREEQTAYLKSVESFQASRRLLAQQAAGLLEALSPEAFDKVIAVTRKDMVGCWTTAGMKQDMKTLFDSARAMMEEAYAQAEQARGLIESAYRRFHEEHAFPTLAPPHLSLQPYLQELDRLHAEAEAFRNSPVTTMTEQSFVVRKFFVSLVSHARNLLLKAHGEAESWLKGALRPLGAQIKEHKHLMEQRLETLRRINESRGTLDGKVRELTAQCQGLEAQMDHLGEIRERLHTPIPAEEVPRPTPARAVC